MEVAAADAEFLARTLPNLPHSGEGRAAATLDSNGQVIVRDTGKGQHKPTELVLTAPGWNASH